MIRSGWHSQCPLNNVPPGPWTHKLWRVFSEDESSYWGKRDKTIVKAKFIDRRVDFLADPDTMSLQGLMGEVIVNELYGKRITIDGYSGPDSGNDFILPDGRAAQVKASGYLNGHFILPPFHTMTADVGIGTTRLAWNLSHGLWVYCVQGWISKEEFDKINEVIDLGRGPVQSVHYSVMHDIMELL